MMADLQATLVSVADVLAGLSAHAKPLKARRVSVEEAVGGVLAEPLRVEHPVPAQPTALRPGYAVNSSDLVGISSYAPLVVPGHPPWVEAGAALPSGTDAVLPRDALAESGSFVEILAGAAPGENVCRTGEDAPPGAILREAGERLRPRDVAIARLAGVSHATVRMPRVRVIAGAGHEGSLDAALRFAGIDGAAVLGDQEGLPGLGATEADLLILATGDASLRDRALQQATHVLASGIALRPGETTQIAIVGTLPIVIILPRLDVLFAVSRCIVHPFLGVVTCANPARSRRRGPLTRKLSSAVGFTEVALLRRAEEGIEPLGIGSLNLPAFARAQGWLALPPESEGHRAGDMIEAFDI